MADSFLASIYIINTQVDKHLSTVADISVRGNGEVYWLAHRYYIIVAWQIFPVQLFNHAKAST